MSQPRSPAPILAAAQAEPLPETSQMCDTAAQDNSLDASHRPGRSADRYVTPAGVAGMPKSPGCRRRSVTRREPNNSRACTRR
jgi:hypothetical protein